MITFHEDMAAPMISTLSLHDALPILGDRNGPDRQPRTCRAGARAHSQRDRGAQRESGGKPPHPLWRQRQGGERGRALDRKSTRLNSSHVKISYAVFCLKKKKKKKA